jgi:hypothetical protein
VGSGFSFLLGSRFPISSLFVFFVFFFGTVGVWVSNWAGELFDFHMNVKVTTLNYVFINL